MEDKSKVDAKVKELNKSESPGKQGWLALEGFHALTKFDYGSDKNSPTFYPSSGLPVKVFINAATGEIRIFPASRYKKENG